MKYQVLYLADIPYLSAQRIENVKRFVEEGGGLLVSYSTSLFDAAGRKTDQFGLERLLRVRPVKPNGPLRELVESYTTMVGGPNELYLICSDAGGEHFDQWRNRIVPLWFYEPVSVLKGGETIAEIVTGDGLRPVLPGIVVSRHGKGKVAYLSSSLESLYLGSNIRDLADLVHTLVRWVSPQPQPFELQGPEALIANMTFKGDTRVVHLANWTGNKFERRWVNEYYLAPIQNVRLQVLIPEGRTAIDVKPLVKDHSVQAAVRGKYLTVLIPRMNAYQAIAVTFASEP
jgi:hypothetical protein